MIPPASSSASPGGNLGRWIALPDTAAGGRNPKIPRVTFCCPTMGRPRVLFNTPAAVRLGLAAGAKITFFGVKGATTPEVGLAVNTGGPSLVKQAKSSKSLQCSTSALEHLTNFKKIVFSITPTSTGAGGPQWILKPEFSERKAGR